MPLLRSIVLISNETPYINNGELKIENENENLNPIQQFLVDFIRLNNI